MMKKFIKAVLAGMMFLCCLACVNRVSARDKDGDLVVIIDPGHGGRDGGAVQNGLTEKEINWNIATSLKAELETYEGVKVYLTKGYAEWNSNTGRGRYGVGLGGDIFISCHNNSGSATARGSIVFTTVNSKYHNEMGKLANLILDNLNQAGFIRNGIQSRPSSGNPSADYYTALDEAAKAGMPSMIIEHCYISNAEDAAFISNLENQYKAGAADATGIAQYYGLKKRTVSAGSSINLTRTYSASFTGVQGKFASSDENVAYVSDNGLITAMSQGSAVITCTSDDGSKKTVNVTVPAVTQVAVTAGINPTFYDNVNQAKNIDTSLVMMKAVYSEESMASYFIENLDKIRHTVVKLSPVTADALEQQQKFEEKDGIITSNRLDSMIACVYKFSRSQALEFFKAEKVFVNGKCVQNPSYRCKEADIISVRGYGRFVFEREMGETNKGRMKVRYKLYG